MLKRVHNYPPTSEVQRKKGHVYVKDYDGKWHPRGRVKAARELGRELEVNERVFHANGKPDDDNPSNLVVIRFTGTEYYIPHSKPVYIPSIVKTSSRGNAKVKEIA